MDSSALSNTCSTGGKKLSCSFYGRVTWPPLFCRGFLLLWLWGPRKKRPDTTKRQTNINKSQLSHAGNVEPILSIPITVPHWLLLQSLPIVLQRPSPWCVMTPFQLSNTSVPKKLVGQDLSHTGEHHGNPWLLPFPDIRHPPLLDISPTQLCRASSSFPAALFTPCLAMVLARPFGRAPFPTKLPRTLPPTLGRTLPRTLARTPPRAGVSVGVESDSVAVAEAFWSWGPARDIYVHIERERERETNTLYKYHYV